MATRLVGTAIVDYSDRRGGWGQGPYAGEAVPIWIPRGVMDLMCGRRGTHTPGEQHFGHQGRLHIWIDGPGTVGGTQSVMLLGSSSSSSSSSSSRSSSSSSSLKP